MYICEILVEILFYFYLIISTIRYFKNDVTRIFYSALYELNILQKER